jgi:hypothetical protein
MARFSRLDDVLIGQVLQADMAPYETSERELASGYLHRLMADDQKWLLVSRRANQGGFIRETYGRCRCRDFQIIMSGRGELRLKSMALLLTLP